MKQYLLLWYIICISTNSVRNYYPFLELENPVDSNRGIAFVLLIISKNHYFSVATYTRTRTLLTVLPRGQRKRDVVKSDVNLTSQPDTWNVCRLGTRFRADKPIVNTQVCFTQYSGILCDC